MAAEGYDPTVEVEEVITRVLPGDNGAGPLWCYGSPCIVRDGRHVYVSISETDPALDRLCNTRWTVWKRDENAWSMICYGDHYDEREPCPLAHLPGNRLLISVNPLADRTSMTRGGACIPHIMAISPTGDRISPLRMPDWDQVSEAFTEHSYRGLGVDYDNKALLLFNIDAHRGYAWSLLEEEDLWAHEGFFSFPIRACYPQIGLKNGAAHVMAIGDIIETNPAWRRFKKEKTGHDWDYDFRRLFYTWTPDIRKVPFLPSIEIASFEETAGYIKNGDLLIDDEDNVHLLFTTKNIWRDFMRDAFFSDRPIISTVEYRVLKDGKQIRSHTLTSHVKDKNNTDESSPFYTAVGFHADTTNRVYVVFTGGGDVYVMQVSPWIGDTPSEIPLKNPISNFMMPTPRNGSTMIDTIDMYGIGPKSEDMHYVRVRLGS